MEVPDEVVLKINQLIELEKKVLEDKGAVLRWAVDYDLGLLFMECLSQKLSGEEFKQFAENEANNKGNIPLFVWPYIVEPNVGKEKKGVKHLLIPSQELLHALSLKAKYEDQRMVLWTISQGGAYLKVQHGNYQLPLYNQNGEYVAELIKNDQLSADLNYFNSI